MNAEQVVQLLADRHFNDVFVRECKNGPSQMTSHARLDGWAMAKSWANPRMVGYEVKVARGDFLQDTKWPAYLPLCNELYFVCPPKLIQPGEVPEAAGLIWAGARLLTKKRAPYREIPPPVDLLKYVLMSRAEISRYERIAQPDGDARSRRIESMRRWIENRKEGEEVGYIIRRRMGDEMRRLKSENAQLKAENARLEPTRAKLKELGFPAWSGPDQVEAASQRLKQEIPPEFVRYTREMANRIGILAERLEHLHGNHTHPKNA